MSKWTWLLSLYILGLTGAAFYSVYLMNKAKGLYDGDVQIVGGKDITSEKTDTAGKKVTELVGVEGPKQGGLLNAIRDAVSYYKYLSYALIIGNAFVIISLMLLDFKITWRTDPIIPVPSLPAIGGRRR